MNQLLQAIDALLEIKPVIIAIDGPCAGGKSTLAEKLKAHYEDTAIYHMDDFFLLPEQSTAERLSIPGNNVDHERFLNEVLLPLKEGQPFAYRAYSCKSKNFEERAAMPARLSIIEGSYCLHPSLQAHYDLKVFLDIDADEQASRIVRRNPATGAARFFAEWIPLENKYFETFAIRDICDIHLIQ
jgi:uridine kinase